MKEKLLGGILGLAIGDALGVPVEFKNRDFLDTQPVTDMIAYGTHNKPDGTWSDDTSLTLCLLDSLCEGLKYEEIAHKFIAWYYDALWTADGTTFDIGGTTRSAIINMNNGKDPILCGMNDEYSNGNGSLMRILPLSFYLINKNEDEQREIIFNVSALTHRHIRSQLACWLYVKIAINLLNGLTRKESVDLSYQVVSEWASKDNMNDEWDNFKRCNSTIASIDRNNIQSSGYVIDTLEASLWCFLITDNYEKAVLKAVNLGDDTDTTAAVTGGLAGIYYGFESIRKDWINKLLKHKEMIELCNSFYNSLVF